MSESKFTPGPWGIQDDHGKRWIETTTGNDDTIAEIHRRRDKGSVYSCGEALANAKLIAAAPDLYKALERIARPHDCGCVPCTGSCTSEMSLQITVEEMRELARAAIFKATA
ncbi:hypothetical protein K5E40_03715 [Pseudomonas baetica]|uniref:hypothetical protein n=1 Tax=Pseudomonas baetica TaxID=674054 RepID=UPI001C8CE56B|nr:hypothetical protein [Pseudomonas baetica]MBX9404782.1 hypothetical protein [Pseudomonas baetica]